LPLLQEGIPLQSISKEIQGEDWNFQTAKRGPASKGLDQAEQD
jgi:hypothetical protein